MRTTPLWLGSGYWSERGTLHSTVTWNASQQEHSGDVWSPSTWGGVSCHSTIRVHICTVNHIGISGRVQQHCSKLQDTDGDIMFILVGKYRVHSIEYSNVEKHVNKSTLTHFNNSDIKEYLSSNPSPHPPPTHTFNRSFIKVVNTSFCKGAVPSFIYKTHVQRKREREREVNHKAE